MIRIQRDRPRQPPGFAISSKRAGRMELFLDVEKRRSSNVSAIWQQLVFQRRRQAAVAEARSLGIGPIYRSQRENRQLVRAVRIRTSRKKKKNKKKKKTKKKKKLKKRKKKKKKKKNKKKEKKKKKKKKKRKKKKNKKKKKKKNVQGTCNRSPANTQAEKIQGRRLRGSAVVGRKGRFCRPIGSQPETGKEPDC